MSRLSVIIPTYQHAATLPECLESVLTQTRKPDEVIVVDDGSVDGTPMVLEPFRARGVQVIRTENHGSNQARNTGFKASSGQLVMFCDADALLRPDTLEHFEQALEHHPKASYAYSGFRFGWKSFASFPFSAERLRRMNYIHTTSLIRRPDFPGFDERVKRLQDWDLWLTMLEQGKEGVFVEGELIRIVDAHGRVGISRWLPSLAYRIPWEWLGWMPSSVRTFKEAKAVIVKKHRL
ncbi:hypothetical protein A2856_02270 [Candidatus Uhrbacteria bacterium RIFCSPHIGHO2_01_FULL_63_20]|uniref:Glycosyltransferase 2-like domain-containing protein n=1 Tax=Candidatus Uhrbacteria bacterium RIFCSPHIGHO2_01_FULL_63_20 TaxID=1802385 RepID=A0A1F7TKK3_9BACT|nr:MAG: hypothetical protein A2856_02270 [Candidatus Uhrbacteria bacterium RIFCSPHIGHO2_01_FULL_63_20]